MENYQRMALFTRVVQHGSMSGAGRALGMSSSAVSQQIRKLEEEGGVTLLHRSTRKLTLTEAGERFHQGCAAMVKAAEQAQAELSASRDTPSGLLRVSLPVGFASHICVALGTMLADYPALRLKMDIDDAPIDLIEARIDLAIRFGTLKDSSWVARRLGAFEMWLCATPQWVQIHGRPEWPDALLAHQWLANGLEQNTLKLELLGPHGEHRALHIEPRIVTNNQLSLLKMCLSGLGLAVVGSLDAQEHVATGQLVRLLPQWRLHRLDIWAVTPQRSTQPAHVRMAIQAFRTYLHSLPGVDA